MASNNLYSLAPGLRKTLAALTPRSLRSLLRVNYVMMMQMGHLRAARTRKVVWNGKPCPWFTYPAIEYLEGLDFSGRSLFEFGSGFSSVYWADVGARVTTIDDDPRWHGWLKQHMPAGGGVELLLETEKARYVGSIDHRGKFDVIVVDGVHRSECAGRAWEHLAPNGMIILDNSDWFPQVAANLRSVGLIQVDFFGFAPGQDFRGSTSLFLNRAWDFKPKMERQPREPVGGLPQSETQRIWPAVPDGNLKADAAPPPQ